jgi:phospholipid/cholesterol/gamma-HCH transport system substrate-binding protein
VFHSDAPRCGPDPDGVEGQQAPLVPGVPPAVEQLVNGVLPNGLPENAPALPIFGPIPTGGDR